MPYDEHSPENASGTQLEKLTIIYGIAPRQVNPETGEIEDDEALRRRILDHVQSLIAASAKTIMTTTP